MTPERESGRPPVKETAANLCDEARVDSTSRVRFPGSGESAGVATRPGGLIPTRRDALDAADTLDGTTPPRLPGRVRSAPLDVDACRAAWVAWLVAGLVDVRHDDDVTDASPLGSCWYWRGSVDRDGYGRRYVTGSTRLAHRVAVVAARGRDIPPGLVVDHLCRRPPCVRPSHLDVVTQRDNIARGESTSAAAAGTGVCARGHLVAGANARRRRDGFGECRACDATATAIHDATRQGHPYRDPERVRPILAAAYAAAYVLGIEPRQVMRPTRPDALDRVVVFLAAVDPDSLTAAGRPVPPVDPDVVALVVSLAPHRRPGRAA